MLALFGTLSKVVLIRIQKERKNSVFAGHAKESKTKDIRTNVDIVDLKNALRKHRYRAQVEFGFGPSEPRLLP